MAFNLKSWCKNSAQNIILAVLSGGHALSTAGYAAASASGGKLINLIPTLEEASAKKQVYAGLSGFAAFSVNTSLNMFFIPRSVRKFLEICGQLLKGEVSKTLFAFYVVPAICATIVNSAITYNGLAELPVLAWTIVSISVPPTLATRFTGWVGIKDLCQRWWRGDNRDQLDLMAALSHTRPDYVPEHFQHSQATEEEVCKAWVAAYYNEALTSDRFAQRSGLNSNPFTTSASSYIYLPYYFSGFPALASLYTMFMIFSANAGAGISAIINYTAHTNLAGDEPFLAYVVNPLMALPNLAFYAYACQLACGTMINNIRDLYRRTHSVFWTVLALGLEYGLLGLAANSVVGLVEGAVAAGHIEKAYHVDRDADYITTIIDLSRAIGVFVNAHGTLRMIAQALFGFNKPMLPIADPEAGESLNINEDPTERTTLINRPASQGVNALEILGYLEGTSFPFTGAPLPANQMMSYVEEMPSRPQRSQQTSVRSFPFFKEMHKAFKEEVTTRTAIPIP